MRWPPFVGESSAAGPSKTKRNLHRALATSSLCASVLLPPFSLVIVCGVRAAPAPVGHATNERKLRGELPPGQIPHYFRASKELYCQPPHGRGL